MRAYLTVAGHVDATAALKAALPGELSGIVTGEGLCYTYKTYISPRRTCTMDLKLDEQLLVTNFRRLDQEGKKDLLDYAAVLVKKCRSESSDETAPAENQCSLEAKAEKRPEAAKEPIFTE